MRMEACGDWSLPFDGCAEYVPHLNLWLAFSRETPQDVVLDVRALWLANGTAT